MKKLILRTLIVSLSVLVLLVSCQKENKITEFESFASSTKIDSIDRSCVIDVELLFPMSFNKADVLHKIQQAILTTAFDSTYAALSAEEAVKTFNTNTLNDFNILIANDTTNLLAIYGEEWLLNTDVIFNESNILSYDISRYTYTGGAHGMETTQYLVFDLKTGDKLSQSAIFAEGFETPIAEMLKKQIMKDKELETEEEMLMNGYFMIENIFPNENFYLDTEGITFMFNPYEIAAYSNGQTKATLSYEQIAPYLRENNPLKGILQTALKK